MLKDFNNLDKVSPEKLGSRLSNDLPHFSGFFILSYMIKPIVNFPNYFASDDGEIYTTKRGKMKRLSPDITKNGIVRVTLRKNNTHYKKTVSVLILETFISPRPSGMLACHGANGRRDNNLNNLYWASSSRNNGVDKLRDGTMPDYSGEKNPCSKLNEVQVRIIRKSYSRYGKSGLNAVALGLIFNVSSTTIQKIVKRMKWAGVN